MNPNEIVNRIIGKTVPIGETNADEVRFENLKAKCELVECLVRELDELSKLSSSHEFSVKRAGQYAADCLSEITQELSGKETK